MVVSFETFAIDTGPRLRAGLVAAYGTEVGLEAAADALAYGWENRDRIMSMDNPAGYLFRVGQTSARRSRRRQGHMPQPTAVDLPDFEPRLVPSLELLTESQRTAVLLVHAFGWPKIEAAQLMGITVSSLRTHLARGITKLQEVLEVEPHVGT